MKKKKILSFLLALLLVCMPVEYAGAADTETQTETAEERDPALIYQFYCGGQWMEKDTSVTSEEEQNDQMLQALKINTKNEDEKNTVLYRVKLQNQDWQDWTLEGKIAGDQKGTAGIEAVEIKLQGEWTNSRSVRYRVCIPGKGWQDYVENGQTAGLENSEETICGLEILLEEETEDTEQIKEEEKTEEILPSVPLEQAEVISNAGVSYTAKIQNRPEQNPSRDGAVSGEPGSSLALEGISIRLNQEGENKIPGSIQYRTHIQNIGWTEWKEDGEYSGTIGKALRMEAMEVKLTGEIAVSYDVYYSVYVQNKGWLGWAKNGQSAGTQELARRLEAVKICFVKKGQQAPGENTGYFLKGYPASALTFQSHIQTDGDVAVKGSGQLIGTTGEQKRIEGISIRLDKGGEEGYLNGGIQYQVHIQNIGWQGWKHDGGYAGTKGKALRVEAIEIQLTGELAQYYDIYYTPHIQQLGWLGWAKNGQKAGSEALSYRMEALKVCLIRKGEPAPGKESGSFIQGIANGNLKYSSHVQNIGNTSAVSNNQVVGTVGKKLRMEGIKIWFQNPSMNGKSGGIRYQSHIQNIGWQGWKQNGQLSGTSGRSLRLEAVRIELTGEIAKYYDIYYRAHVQNFGWLGWAKNGQDAGTAGYAYRMEALQLQLIPKGGTAPVSGNSFKQYTGKKSLNVPMYYQYPKYPNGCEAVSLYMALRYNGYMVTPDEVCYRYMPRGPLHSTNPYVAYMGNPGSLTGGYGCWASVICKTAQNYFNAVHIRTKTPRNITGTSMEGLFGYIDRGIPVVVWGTLNMGSTTWFKAGSSGGVSYYWPSKAHCVVMTGYDKNRKVVKVNDPIRGKVEYSFSSFERAFHTMGKNAMVIQ
nr:C39 family peptidase [uncultured Sellimonas sp.]